GQYFIERLNLHIMCNQFFQHVSSFITFIDTYRPLVITGTDRLKSHRRERNRYAVEADLKNIFFKLPFDEIDITIEDFFSFINQNNPIADFFYLLHAVCTEN